MLFIIYVASFISNLSGEVYVGTVFAIPLVIPHLTVVFIPIGILHSPLQKLVVIESTLELCSIIQLQISSARGPVLSPLSVIGSSLETEETISLLFIILPVSVIVLVGAIEIISLPIFHSVSPCPLVYSLSCSYIDQYSLSMLFAVSKITSIGQITGFKIILSLSVVLTVFYSSVVDVSILQIYSYCSFGRS